MGGRGCCSGVGTRKDDALLLMLGLALMVGLMWSNAAIARSSFKDLHVVGISACEGVLAKVLLT